MKKNPVCLAIYTIMLVCIATLEFGKTAAIETITTIKLTACTSGSLTLPVHEALSKVHISWIDYIALKYWDSRGNNWIDVLHYNRSMVCFIWKPLLPDGTRVLSCANGSLTLEFFFQSSFRKFAKYLSEVHLLNRSVVRHIFEVNFAKCIRRRKDANLNLTEVLVNTLPWKQVIDINFFDTNDTAFAYCKPGRCTMLISPRQIEASPSLHWLKRWDNSAGSSVLKRIQMDDDWRKIIIKVRTTETAREETLMIRVTASQEPTPTINGTVAYRSRLSSSKMLTHTSFVSVSRHSLKNTLTDGPNHPPSKAASWSNFGVSAFVSSTAHAPQQFTPSVRSSASDFHTELWRSSSFIFLTIAACFL